jgi:pimeloyl-ACP methyl ester carboxylesterase
MAFGRIFLRSFLASLALGTTLLAASAPQAATPPPQPKSGPGGADYVAEEVTKRAVGRASAATFVFHAAGEATQPRPVVVLLHAWGAANPQVYGGWIEHLARKGYLVLYPRFQEVGRTRPADATGNALTLVKDALAELASDSQARPDPNRVAFIGHTAGAAVALNLAAQAKAENLPVPKLVFVVMPGGIARDPKSRGIPLADLSQIDASTMLITMIGDREFRAADAAARRILQDATEVPANRKTFMRALSDDHGFPSISATLASPGSAKDAFDGTKIRIPPDPPGDPRAQRQARQKWSPDMALSGEQSVLVSQLGTNTTDSLDYWGYWKTFDMAAAAAFAGRDAQVLRNDPSFTDMNRWSDGWPVKRLSAVDAPRVDTPAPAKAAPAPTKVPVARSKRRSTSATDGSLPR